LTEFGGKGDRISKDGLGDGGIRRWGDGENLKLEILKFACRQAGGSEHPKKRMRSSFNKKMG